MIVVFRKMVRKNIVKKEIVFKKHQIFTPAEIIIFYFLKQQYTDLKLLTYSQSTNSLQTQNRDSNFWHATWIYLIK